MEVVGIDFLQAVANPISADQPEGENVRSEDDFQQIKEEFGKMHLIGIGSFDSSDESGAQSDEDQFRVDYDLIETLSRKILTQASKDLQVACYLTIALAETKSVAGLAEGLQVINVLMDTFWESMYPGPIPRKLGVRRNSFDSMANQLVDFLKEYKPVEADAEAIERALAEFEKIDQTTTRLMEHKRPNLLYLSDELKSLQRKIEASKPKEKPPVVESRPEQKPEPVARPRTDAAADRDEGPREWKHANDVKKTLLEAASFLRSQDPTDPVPYHLLRVLRWGGLQQEPPRAQDGSKQTRLPAVDKQVQIRLQNLMAAGNYERAVQEAEEAFQRSPHHFWFYLQHMQAKALQALGEPYRPVLESVCLNLAVLLHRFPTLASLEFKDGTPFADAQDRLWIEEEVAIQSAQGEAASAESVSQDARADIVEQYNEARRILVQKGLPETIRYMQDGAEKDVATKDKFLRKLYIASLCLDGGRPLIAQPILEDLEVEIDKHDLQDWDPDLVIQVLKKLYICYDSIGSKVKNADALRSKKEIIFNRISKLDPIKALSLE